MTKVMSAKDLILCLSGELLVDPALLVETIREEEDLTRLVRSYGAGDFTYEQVKDTLKDLFQCFIIGESQAILSLMVAHQELDPPNERERERDYERFFSK